MKLSYLWSFIFCLIVAFYFVNSLIIVNNDYYDAYLSFNQQTMPILGQITLGATAIILDAFLLFLVISLFCYYFRQLKPFYYYLIGYSIKYWMVMPLIFLILYGHYKQQLNLSSMSLLLCSIAILVFMFDFILHTIAIFYGYTLWQETFKQGFYLNENDKLKGTFMGIPKLLWLFILFGFNQVYLFCSKLLFLVLSAPFWLYFKISYWQPLFTWDFYKHLGKIFSPFIVTSIFLALLGAFFSCVGLIYWYGISAIINKEDEYRILKIILIFIFIPILFFFVNIYVLKHFWWA